MNSATKRAFFPLRFKIYSLHLQHKKEKLSTFSFESFDFMERYYFFFIFEWHQLSSMKILLKSLL